jgi:hypothetical protein
LALAISYLAFTGIVEEKLPRTSLERFSLKTILGDRKIYREKTILKLRKTKFYLLTEVIFTILISI